MKIKILSGILLSVALLATQHASAAPVITLDPSADSITGPGSLSVDINISNLEEVLAGFSMIFRFDPAVFEPVASPVIFGDNLGDLASFGAFGSVIDTTPGEFDLALISFLFPADLDALQGDPAGSGLFKDFTLASIGLNRVGGMGLTSFSAENILLSSASGEAIVPPFSSAVASVELDPSSVPAPATGLLMLLAGLGFSASSRRKRASA